MNVNPHSIGTLGELLESVFHGISGASRITEACESLELALRRASETPTPKLPEGVRADIHRLIALLTLPNWEEIVRWAATLNVDLRDLTPREFCYLEHIKEKTAAGWRSAGMGPAWRNEFGIRYPVREAYEWRKKGRQTLVSQGARRGRRPSR